MVATANHTFGYTYICCRLLCIYINLTGRSIYDNNYTKMSDVSNETMEIFKCIGDLTSIHSTSYALRLLKDSQKMQNLVNEND